MIIDVLQDLGLAKNEARIYETLLKEGEVGVSVISAKAQINRRNVYDSLNRLIEKGLIFEIRTATENRYRGVEPKKLTEMIDEKKERLASVLPEMSKLYFGTPRKEEVFIYRGVEGWKNYLRDVLRVCEDTYTLGAKGAWMDAKLGDFMKVFLREARDAEITFHLLFDHEVREVKHSVIDLPGGNYKFLPKEYSTPVTVEVFGDHVVTFPGIALGAFDEQPSLTVVVNREIADAYRTWFRLIWSLLPDETSREV